MTLMDAPTFNEARYRRNRTILYSLVGFLVAAFIASWFISGRPVDWPWNWWTHFMGRVTVSRFLDTVEHDDLQKAYAIWMHDPNWQQHQAAFNAYPFDRFQKDKGGSMDPKALDKAYAAQVNDPNWKRHSEELKSYTFQRFEEDWSPKSSQNEYGVIRTHKIVAARMSGNVLLMGILINGLKTNALFLNYDPKDHSLGFSPVQLYLGP
ncbi:MAG TPA: hypothetical protein VKR52_09395 [Terracidiphilus sp.]|nr:hypothetical protein [Terracidiphilus sp.]